MTDPAPIERPQTPSFTKVWEVADLSADPKSVSLTVGEDDLAPLAAFLDVLGLGALSGTASVTKHGPLVRVAGRVQAQLTRACVATLDPLDETVDEAFDVMFTEEHEPAQGPEEVLADLDAPEPIEGGVLEMADVFLEQLVLAMDPHPRKVGAEPLQDPGAGATISPFSVLKDLKP